MAAIFQKGHIHSKWYRPTGSHIPFMVGILYIHSVAIFFLHLVQGQGCFSNVCMWTSYAIFGCNVTQFTLQILHLDKWNLTEINVEVIVNDLAELGCKALTWLIAKLVTIFLETMTGFSIKTVDHVRLFIPPQSHNPVRAVRCWLSLLHREYTYIAKCWKIKLLQSFWLRYEFIHSIK